MHIVSMETPVGSEQIKRSFFDGIDEDDYFRIILRTSLSFQDRLIVNYYFSQKISTSFEVIADQMRLEPYELAGLLGEAESLVRDILEEREQAAVVFDALDSKPPRPTPIKAPVMMLDGKIQNCTGLSPGDKDLFTGTLQQRRLAQKLYCSRCLGIDACRDAAVKAVNSTNTDVVYGGMTGRALWRYVQKQRTANGVGTELVV